MYNIALQNFIIQNKKGNFFRFKYFIYTRDIKERKLINGTLKEN